MDTPSPTDLEARYAQLLADIRAEFPGFRIVRKDQSGWQRAIHGALIVLTVGSQRRYLDGYQTTIGRTVYVTSGWDELPAAQRWATMRHERVHLRQFRRWTLPGMAFLYLFVPLPLGLAWCRAAFERAGYEETIRATAELHGANFVRGSAFRAYIVEQFTRGAYGWMWPFRRSVERWYDGVVDSLEEPHG